MIKKDLGLCGLGNGLVDILTHLDERAFATLGFEKASMRLVEEKEQQEIINRLSDQEMQLASGGSVANSVVAFAQLGGKSAFLTSLGDDRYGVHFKSEFDQLGIELGAGLKLGKSTGTSLVIITPDAERTMRVSLGAAASLSPHDVSEELICRAEWLFIEGYVFANPDVGPRSIQCAVEFARKHKTKIALTVSEAWVVQNFGKALAPILEQSDLVFCNESEACALSAQGDAIKAFDALAKRFPGCVVTRGEKGALLSWQGEQVQVESLPCVPLDLTGAGDMFAASTLFGLEQNLPLREVGRSACYMARQVITRLGARLHSGAKQYWSEALEA